MEKKLTKEERIKEKEKLSVAVTGKMTAVFIALVVALMGLIYYGSRIPSLALLTASQVVTALLVAAALVYCVLSLKKGTDTRFKVFSPIFTLGLAASAFFMTLMYPTVGATYTILALIAFAVIFFVYEIYPVDFFFSTALIFAGCITAAAVNSHAFTLVKDIIAVVVFAVVAAAIVYATVCLVKNGKLKLGKKVIKKPYGMLPAAVIASAVAAAVSVLGVLFLGGYLMYFIAVAGIVYFVLAIIYTVKLM
ncbi:MAG: hypothetical protein IJ002_05185 [Clostridia bacterium]|nr:hypothetical protein [Clostridia bacterium]